MPVLQFKGKTAVENYHWTVPHHVIEFDKKLSVLEKGQKPNLDGNLIIEGDNLLALKALLPTHAGRVKCIYIDPPYNTGNEGWVYNDNLTQPQFKEWIGQTVGKEGDDACRHDKWCCMMYPRLALLKELLRDDGSIWVSIDDNEVHHLRMLMDEVFGEHNRITGVVRQTRSSPDNDEQYITAIHDSLVVYAKEKSSLPMFRFERTAEQDERYENPDNDPRGPWTSSDLTRREFREHDFYEILLPSGRKVKPSQGRSWSVPADEFERLRAENRIWFGPNGNAMPRRKRFLSDVRGGLVPVSWWSADLGVKNEDGKREMNRIFSERTDAFANPKPIALIRRILQLCTKDDDIVLDSFAGSGTTGHSTLELNGEDNGNRTFILVQIRNETKEQEQAETNICRELTCERLKRAISGYASENGNGKKTNVPGLGGSFTYARLGGPLFGEFRNLSEPYPTYEQLASYIFYTETSHDFDVKALNAKTGRIGEYKQSAYYLLFSNDETGRQAMDAVWLKEVGAKEKCRHLVVYCEKFWLHREELTKWELDHDKKVRTMIVPNQLK